MWQRRVCEQWSLLLLQLLLLWCLFKSKQWPVLGGRVYDSVCARLCVVVCNAPSHWSLSRIFTKWHIKHTSQQQQFIISLLSRTHLLVSHSVLTEFLLVFTLEHTHAHTLLIGMPLSFSVTFDTTHHVIGAAACDNTAVAACNIFQFFIFQLKNLINSPFFAIKQLLGQCSQVTAWYKIVIFSFVWLFFQLWLETWWFWQSTSNLYLQS